MSKIGVSAVGVHIPYYYMERNTIGSAWGTRGKKGVRSIANADEDSITMAVEAARKALKPREKGCITSLYFASVSAPYLEKSNAAVIATACDLRREILSADLTACTKSGTTAIKAAMDSVAATPGTKVLVAAADCRNAHPKSEKEHLFGDAGAAVILGTEDLLATIDCFSTVTDEIVDVWRNDGERYVNVGEDRFIKTAGYKNSMAAAIQDVMKHSGLRPRDFAKVVLATPGLRDHLDLAKKIGFAPEQVQDSLMTEVGDCGTAQPLLLLAYALEQAKPGDKLLLAAYGNGADAMVLTVTEQVSRIRESAMVKRQLAARVEFKEYARFLAFRNGCEYESNNRYSVKGSNSMTWRKKDVFLRFKGSHCKKCGAEIFPINRVCHNCGAVDEYELVDCSERKPRVVTYTMDLLAGDSVDPIIGQVVADDENGTRYYTIMTDFRPDEVKVGLQLEFTFRKMNTLANFNNYYWKFKPIRDEGSVQ